jgi:RNA polymerase sigma-70 factor (ECF subfamily)
MRAAPPHPSLALQKAMDSCLQLRPRSDALVDRLRARGDEREGALSELHALLLRAARFEVSRRAPSLPHLRGNELDDIALEAADDALLAVLAKLDEFRGACRFTTWAYKFALLEAASKLRRRAWQRREIPLEPEDWTLFSDPAGSPAAEVERTELLSAIRRAIATALTPRQRDVLVAVAVNDVPADVLAERLGTTRGALYKSLHDARAKLRSELARFGMGPAVSPVRPRPMHPRVAAPAGQDRLPAA